MVESERHLGLAAQAMGVELHECCVVEDSGLGLQAANRAKMKSIYYALQ
tara:strand:+ start:466 stop:612 length:147 start_codon:yes stop_codon:yes gene_type:complete